MGITKYQIKRQEWQRNIWRKKNLKIFFWGIQRGMDDLRVKQEITWGGQNMMGRTSMAVRDALMSAAGIPRPVPLMSIEIPEQMNNSPDESGTGHLIILRYHVNMI